MGARGAALAALRARAGGEGPPPPGGGGAAGGEGAALRALAREGAGRAGSAWPPRLSALQARRALEPGLGAGGLGAGGGEGEADPPAPPPGLVECVSLAAEPAPRGSGAGAAWLVRAGVRLGAGGGAEGWALRAPALLALSPGACGRSGPAEGDLPRAGAPPLELSLVLRLPDPSAVASASGSPEVPVALEAAASPRDGGSGRERGVWYHQVLGRVRLDAGALLGGRCTAARRAGEPSVASSSSAAAPPGGVSVRLLALPEGPSGWDPEALPEALRARGWLVVAEHWSAPTSGRLALTAPPDASLAGCSVTLRFAGEAEVAELELRAPGSAEAAALARGLAAEFAAAGGGVRLAPSLVGAAEVAAGRAAAAEVAGLARAARATLEAVRAALRSLDAGAGGGGGAGRAEEAGEAVASAQRQLRWRQHRAWVEVSRATWPLEAAAPLGLPPSPERVRGAAGAPGSQP